MYERIIQSEKTWGELSTYFYHDIYSSDLREILHTAKTFEEAKHWLEQQVRMERLSCPTGGCDDS